MVYDALMVIAQSRMEDKQRDAARRALLAEACSAATRSTIAVRTGHLFVWIGERIEGVRYAPATTLAPHHSSR